ncbi:uncharacterized protein LOC134532391 [Bacillus rossius redtenbacheri]|uniref:uncharacterized protein LOC134532391 n=1 Tax=Bacillus rossius redtenbacheri TaxID=93214 RepID=UPI002FDDC2E8
MGSTADITVELVQQMLRHVEKDNSIVVLPCLEVNELNEDHHAGSCTCRVTAKYTRCEDTSQNSLSLIVKLAPNLTLTKDLFKVTNLFLREIQMFDEILPRMSTLLSQALPERHTELSARVYFTRKSPSYLIAIEDLAPKGFKSHKRKDGVDLKHSLLAFRALARFHAASVKIRHEDKSLFAVFDTHFMLDGKVDGLLRKMFDNVATVIPQLVQSWPEFGSTWANRLRKRYQTLFEEMIALFHRDDTGFNVLNHGDFGINNVMYRYSEFSREVEEFKLLDFQCCFYNSPVFDLHNFIFTSVSDDVRENHIDTLLKEYHSELTATMKALGTPPEQMISLSDLLEEFDKKLAYGLYCSTTFLLLFNIDLSSISGQSNENVFEAVINDQKKLQSFISDSFAASFKKLLKFFDQKQIL